MNIMDLPKNIIVCQMCRWRSYRLHQLAGLGAETGEVQWGAAGHRVEGEREAAEDVQGAAEAG